MAARADRPRLGGRLHHEADALTATRRREEAHGFADERAFRIGVQLKCMDVLHQAGADAPETPHR